MNYLNAPKLRLAREIILILVGAALAVSLAVAITPKPAKTTEISVPKPRTMSLTEILDIPTVEEIYYRAQNPQWYLEEQSNTIPDFMRGDK